MKRIAPQAAHTGARTVTRFGLGLTLAALAASALAATQWKWRNAEGRVQYSDRPPPTQVAEHDILERPRGRKPKNMAVPEPVASAPSISPPLKAKDPELEAKKRKTEEEAKAKPAEDPKQAQARRDNCERSRGYEKSLTDGVRISRTNSKGEREILDDTGRASELVRTREIITDSCR